MTTSHRPILREEWNFENEDFREKLEPYLYECFAYEYARSVPNILRQFRRDRHSRGGVWHRCLFVRKSDLPDISNCFVDADFPRIDVGWMGPGNGPHLECDEVIGFLGFPKIPFLKVDYQLCDGMRRFGIPRTNALNVVSLFEGIWSESRTNHRVPSDEVYSFQIRWDHGDDAIIKDFKWWLSMHRPHPDVSRGRNFRRRIWDDLRALGVWRLLRCFRGNVHAAAAFVEKEIGRKLYTREEDWIKPRDRAQAIIDDWANRIIYG